MHKHLLIFLLLSPISLYAEENTALDFIECTLPIEELNDFYHLEPWYTKSDDDLEAYVDSTFDVERLEYRRQDIGRLRYRIQVDKHYQHDIYGVTSEVINKNGDKFYGNFFINKENLFTKNNIAITNTEDLFQLKEQSGHFLSYESKETIHINFKTGKGYYKSLSRGIETTYYVPIPIGYHLERKKINLKDCVRLDSADSDEVKRILKEIEEVDAPSEFSGGFTIVMDKDDESEQEKEEDSK